jgi:cell division protein FtsQ
MKPTRRHHRFDRDASARRARAQAHLARVRGGRHGAEDARRRPALPGGRSAVAIAAVAGLLGLWLGDSLWLAAGGGSDTVQVIAVRGAKRLRPADVAAAAGIPAGAPLAQVDAGGVARSLETHDWIGRARALRLPGGAVIVDVHEREPAATVAVGGELYAVDRDGEPFAPVEEDALPGLVRIAPEEPVTPRERSAALALAVRLAESLPKLGLAGPREVRIAPAGDPRGYRLLLPSLDAEVWLGHAEPEARLPALARLLAARPDVAAEATQIDLRFAGQVVLRSEPARDGPAQKAAARGDARPRNLQPTG